MSCEMYTLKLVWGQIRPIVDSFRCQSSDLQTFLRPTSYCYHKTLHVLHHLKLHVEIEGKCGRMLSELRKKHIPVPKPLIMGIIMIFYQHYRNLTMIVTSARVGITEVISTGTRDFILTVAVYTTLRGRVRVSMVTAGGSAAYSSYRRNRNDDFSNHSDLV